MKKEIEILFCDACDLPIQTVDDMGNITWKKDAFQKGLSERTKEIGTWCSQECYTAGQKITLDSHDLHILRGFMTFRDKKPLMKSTLSLASYEIYDNKAPLWQNGDESIPVTITYEIKH